MKVKEIQEIIQHIKEELAQVTAAATVGPSHHELNKMLADLYFQLNEELKGIYHLTEAHAATLRHQTTCRYDYKKDMLLNPTNTKDKIAQGLNKTFVQFDSEISQKEEKDLIARLREMPKEWTVVQVTRQCDPTSSWRLQPKDSVISPSALYITQLPCGPLVDEASPLRVLIPPPESFKEMPTIFNLMHEAKEKLRLKSTSARMILKAREVAADNIKEVVDDLSNRYLREWKCLLLGTLVSQHYASQVTGCIDQVVNNNRHQAYQLNQRFRQLLYRVAGGAVYLSLEEIKSAVCMLVNNKELATDLVTAIESFKEEMSVLMAARRNAVILILDEALDSLPWEMLPILKKHPVSRVPSIHFLHALYLEHKDHIIDGCRLVSRLELGFYIVNPDQNLKEMESRLVKFLEERMPQWKGIKGKVPTEEEFSSALVDNNIFVYCGHYNGSHHFRPEDVSNLRVVALPLLFGCSSVALLELGGRTYPTGVSDRYLMASCACVLGMLWTVTSDDTDCMTVTLLNGFLPGEPVDLKSFRHAGDMLTTKEPELLRLMRYARETAILYSNGAALIARGIPVKMVEG